MPSKGSERKLKPTAVSFSILGVRTKISLSGCFVFGSGFSQCLNDVTCQRLAK